MPGRPTLHHACTHLQARPGHTAAPTTNHTEGQLHDQEEDEMTSDVMSNEVIRHERLGDEGKQQGEGNQAARTEGMIGQARNQGVLHDQAGEQKADVTGRKHCWPGVQEEHDTEAETVPHARTTAATWPHIPMPASPARSTPRTQCRSGPTHEAGRKADVGLVAASLARDPGEQQGRDEEGEDDTEAEEDEPQQIEQA